MTRPTKQYKMTTNDLALVRALAGGPRINAELSRAVGLARRSTYASLRRLEEHGLVESFPCLRDTRKTFWALTGVTLAPEAGAEAVASA